MSELNMAAPDEEEAKVTLQTGSPAPMDADAGSCHRKCRLTFGVDESPPFHIAAFYAFQMVVSNLPGNVSAVFLIHATICGGKDYVFLAQLLSSSIVMTGVASLLQVLLGVRLPVAQGSAFSFFPPIIAMMSSEAWRCPEQIQSGLNVTDGIPLMDEAWVERIRMISGGLVLASLVQVVLGVTGLVGLLTTFIGPITIAPAIMLIGICLFGFIKDASKHQWGISLLTAVLMIVFSVVGGKVNIPVPTWSREKGLHTRRYPLIKMFSNILALGVCWLLSFILTVTGCFPDDKSAVGYLARTDAKQDAITKMSWFYFPYPGQFGAPTVTGVGVVVGMLAATLSSIIESVGDYYATARVCGLPPPPKHALNRGIAMEGTASVLAGFVSTCHGTTSLSQMVGFIAYTGVASRMTWMLMSAMLIFIGIFGKFTGALATVPDPVVGGACLLSLGLVISVGISQLQPVDMESTRNQMALGMALMLGVMIPQYIQEDPSVINTGSAEFDQICLVFLSTGPFIGGFVGCVFDNLLPGTRKERGMDVSETSCDTDSSRSESLAIYDLPFCTQPLRRFKVFSWIPCLPCYNQRRECGSGCRRKCGTRHRTDSCNA